MIVGFREFEGKPSPEWLEAGAVLVGPDGVQYENVKVGSYGSRWKIVGDAGEGVSSERMRELVDDGAGWLIAENIPDTLYIVVDASCGGIEVGNGQGASRVCARSFLASAPRKQSRTWAGGTMLVPTVLSSIR